ncbi:hypothetical protein JCM10207_002319 [Rhodosporidiobolus poonsookiae]
MAAAVNRTLEFKEAVQAKEQAYPPAKRQRVKFGRHRLGPDSQDDAWTTQAEQVATNLRSFNSFLASIRRAYLDLGSSHHSSQPRAVDPAKGLAAWEGVRWLNDRERDEIDFGVKVALRKSVDRVRELEELEKMRLSREKQGAGQAASRLFGASSSSSASSATLASHRSYITLYLNSLLAAVSQRQRDQQEARVKRQLERTQSLGGMGGGGALGMDALGRQMAVKAKADYNARNKGKGREDEAGSRHVGQVPSIYRPVPLSGAEDGEEDDEDNPLGSQLTAEQVQQFEAEESALLKATQSDLEALKSAESSLLEIASLQSQLAMHLTQQAELTDKLWEDAVTVTGKIGEGNQQLTKAKERGRESRMWLLIFLLGSSFTLLFLDAMS